MSDLFSRLAGLDRDLKQSILRHVQALLNTRRGSLRHMPEYGLPEYNSRCEYRYAKKQFIIALKEVIERYEPRILSLSVEEVNTERSDCVLQVKLMATLACVESFCLAALLLRGGEVLVFGQENVQ